jgi:IS5 family transposase
VFVSVLRRIASHACTDASVPDSQVLQAVLRGEDVGAKSGLKVAGIRLKSENSEIRPHQGENVPLLLDL